MVRHKHSSGFLAVADLIEADPLELHRRGASMSTMEVAAGSWTFGKMPASRISDRSSDHGNQHGTPIGRLGDHNRHSADVGRRRNSLSLAGADPTAVRNALKSPARPLNIQAFAGRPCCHCVQTLAVLDYRCMTQPML